ncbi:MAG: (d)CMP kinase, partial [Bdellovibrionales bacterium]|nr:(d)CMP kinase [Bdellovibrionales bacterium]
MPIETTQIETEQIETLPMESIRAEWESSVPSDKVSSVSETTPAATPIVTIDGPAASGKSSVSREIARRFGWSWVSTGTFYRGLAWAANHGGLDRGDEV